MNEINSLPSRNSLFILKFIPHYVALHMHILSLMAGDFKGQVKQKVKLFVSVLQALLRHHLSVECAQTCSKYLIRTVQPICSSGQSTVRNIQNISKSNPAMMHHNQVRFISKMQAFSASKKQSNLPCQQNKG